MRKKLYVIVYYKNGRFFMLGSLCYESKRLAQSHAEGFCEGHFDDDKWTFEIEVVEYCFV